MTEMAGIEYVQDKLPGMEDEMFWCQYYGLTCSDEDCPHTFEDCYEKVV